MSTIANPGIPVQRGVTIQNALKWIAFSAFAAFGLMAYFKAAGRYTNYSAEVYRNYWPERGWLIMHILGGTVALFTGPTQFLTGLRHRNLRLHRWLGKVYLGGVTAGATAAFYLSFTTSPQASLGFALGLFFLALAWSTSSAMAYVAIRRRNIDVHKEWMIRSYVVTYSFVTFRLLFDQQPFAALPLEQRLTITSWMCWAPPLLVTELALQWKRTLAQRR